MVQVAAAIIRSGDAVLACRRPPGKQHPGKWEFPGGKREGGETLRQCLRRELREELGIEARIGPELWRTRHRYPGRPPVELVFFAVAAYRGTVVRRAFAEVRWVPLGALSSLDFLDADRALVARLDHGELDAGREAAGEAERDEAETPR